MTIRDYVPGEDLIDLGGEVIAESLAVGRNLRIDIAGEDGDYIFVRGVRDIGEIDFHGDVAIA